MNQEALPIMPTKRKETLGEQVRRIADQLKEETNLQIKATSRILGAAAQIAANHDQLITEVVNMAEEDLNQKIQVSQTNTYTVTTLKQQFKTLGEAKSHFGLKATSWAALVNKLNKNLPSQNSASTDQFKPSLPERLDRIESELTILRTDVTQILFLLKQLTLEK
jgi:hypothetical protein